MLKTSYCIFVFIIVILHSWELHGSKVTKLGIEVLSLNAKRVSNLWTAKGTNGTESMTVIKVYTFC